MTPRGRALLLLMLLLLLLLVILLLLLLLVLRPQRDEALSAGGCCMVMVMGTGTVRRKRRVSGACPVWTSRIDSLNDIADDAVVAGGDCASWCLPTATSSSPGRTSTPTCWLRLLQLRATAPCGSQRATTTQERPL